MLPIDAFLMFIILKMVERTVLSYYRDPKSDFVRPIPPEDAKPTEAVKTGEGSEKESDRDLG